MKKLSYILVFILVLQPLSAQIFRTTASNKSPVKSINYKTVRYTDEAYMKPELIIADVGVFDDNSNQVLERSENAQIELQVSNWGEGTARDVNLTVTLLSSEIEGLSFDRELALGNIYPGSARQVVVPIEADFTLSTGVAHFVIEINERFGHNTEPVEVKLGTHEYANPEIEIANAAFTNDYGGKVQYNYPVYLDLLIRNKGFKPAKNIVMNVSFENDNCIVLSEGNVLINHIEANGSQAKEIIFTVKKSYPYDVIPIKLQFTDKYNIYSKELNIYLDLKNEIAGRLSVPQEVTPKYEFEIEMPTLSDVDINIPYDSVYFPNRYALVIGNEDYSKHQPILTRESNVIYAKNDAIAFKKYLNYTLGTPEKNIFMLLDATYAEMLREIERVCKIIDKTEGEGELVFYYAGHGFPSENTKEPYLIPIDVSTSNLQSAIKLGDVYKRFSQLNVKKVTVFVDACFTGGGREAGLLATRAFTVVPKYETLGGNLVSFNSSSGVQASLPYKEKKHGIFTYFLLKKLQESNGYVSYSELSEYLKKHVSIESLKVNSQEQDPQVNISPDVQETWEEWSFK